MDGHTKIPADQDEDIQTPFLTQLRDTRTPVTVYLTNGVRLGGIITAFDKIARHPFAADLQARHLDRHNRRAGREAA